jgi:hypothetical protein
MPFESDDESTDILYFNCRLLNRSLIRTKIVTLYLAALSSYIVLHDGKNLSGHHPIRLTLGLNHKKINCMDKIHIIIEV